MDIWQTHAKLCEKSSYILENKNKNKNKKNKTKQAKIKTKQNTLTLKVHNFKQNGAVIQI